MSHIPILPSFLSVVADLSIASEGVAAAKIASQVSKAQKVRQSKAEEEAAAQHKLPPLRKPYLYIHISMVWRS